MPSRLARRAPTTSTRLSPATSAPIAFTIVWVPPVPGSVFTTTDAPDSIWATTCSCSASASSSSVSVEGGRSSCATGRARSPRAAVTRGTCGRVAGERVEDADGRGSRHRPPSPDPTSANDETTRRGATLNQGRCAREAAQPIDDGLRLEHAVRDRERDEGVGVERDLELLAQLAGERRVQERLPLELQLEVAAVAADREGPQQHRCEEVVAGVAPRREADREVHRFDAAHRAQLDALLRDLGRREPRVAQRQLVADEAREQRRLAGDELRQAARMRRGQLDAGARRVDEAHERRAAAHRLEFGDPAPPRRLGDVARDEFGVAEAHSVGARDVLWHGFGGQFVGGSVGLARRGSRPRHRSDPAATHRHPKSKPAKSSEASPHPSRFHLARCDTRR